MHVGIDQTGHENNPMAVIYLASREFCQDIGTLSNRGNPISSGNYRAISDDLAVLI
jgi:hypothetical protein